MIRAIVTPIFFLAACNCVHADERQVNLAEGKFQENRRLSSSKNQREQKRPVEKHPRKNNIFKLKNFQTSNIS
jgi:uncharacterized membrane protein YhiD involved in acid resistance